MIKLDDMTLMAYVDGELDERSAAEVERQLAQQPAMQVRVRQMRETDSMLRAAFNEARRDGEGATVVQFAKPAGNPNPNRAGGWTVVTASLAASLATLMVAGAVGFYGLDGLLERERSEYERQRVSYSVARSETLERALEEEVSGTQVAWQSSDNIGYGAATPVKTWRTESGQFCREFEETSALDGVASTEFGVACRDSDGQWKVRMRYYPE